MVNNWTYVQEAFWSIKLAAQWEVWLPSPLHDYTINIDQEEPFKCHSRINQHCRDQPWFSPGLCWSLTKQFWHTAAALPCHFPLDKTATENSNEVFSNVSHVRLNPYLLNRSYVNGFIIPLITPACPQPTRAPPQRRSQIIRLKWNLAALCSVVHREEQK